MTSRSAPIRSNFKTGTRLLALLLIVVFAGSGCARIGKMLKKGDTADEGVPAEQLYDKAHTFMTRGSWSAAENTFKRLIAQYPYGDYTEQAMVETAYAQYKAGKNEEAISSIDRFIRTYPTHRLTPYMYYLRGLVNSSRDAIFLQRVWKLDASRRDLATPTQAYNDFTIVVERYPNSRYAEDARGRMAELRNIFARHELDVALYYLRRTAYVAAANRAKYLLETYPQSAHQNDAVALLAAAYTGLGNETLAADAERVLRQNEPDHPYLSGNWPDFPSNLLKLNPFAREQSPIDR